MSIPKGAALVIGGWIMLQAGTKAIKEVHWLTMQPDARAVDILARTIWGEARGEGYNGMVAVANVVLNRVGSGVTWWGYDIPSVCLKDWQFSCWNFTDPNRPLLLAVTTADAAFANAVDIAERAVSGTLADNTGGATHYMRDGTQDAVKWDDGATVAARIGRHVFYRGVA